MSTNNDLVKAAIVLLGLQDTVCFESMQEFIQALPSLIAAEIPANITNVIVSNVQPTDSQTQTVWFRQSNSGSFLSINVFSAGAWHPIYPVNTDTASDTLQLFWFLGDPALPPTGWTNTTDAPGVAPGIASVLAATWFSAGGQTYYTAVFTGF